MQGSGVGLDFWPCGRLDWLSRRSHDQFLLATGHRARSVQGAHCRHNSLGAIAHKYAVVHRQDPATYLCVFSTNRLSLMLSRCLAKKYHSLTSSQNAVTSTLRLFSGFPEEDWLFCLLNPFDVSCCTCSLFYKANRKTWWNVVTAPSVSEADLHKVCTQEPKARETMKGKIGLKDNYKETKFPILRLTRP